MNLFEKIVIQLKGLAHDTVDALSDDERTLRQNLRDMESDMEKIREAHVEANSQRIYLTTEISKAQTKLEKAIAYAEKAASKNDDQAVIKFFKDQDSAEKELETLKAQHETAVSVVQQIESKLAEYEEAYAGVKRREEALALRNQAVTASETVNSVLDKVNGMNANSSLGALGRAEEDLAKREARAQAKNEIAQKNRSEDPYEALDKAEKNNSYEERLAALKAKVNKTE